MMLKNWTWNGFVCIIEVNVIRVLPPVAYLVGLWLCHFPLLHFSPPPNCSPCMAHSNEIDPSPSDVCNTSRFTEQWCHMQKKPKSSSWAALPIGWHWSPFCSPQPQTSFSCETIDMGLVYHVGCLFTTRLLHWYQFIPLCDRGTSSRQLAHGCYPTTGRPGVELMTLTTRLPSHPVLS